MVWGYYQWVRWCSEYPHSYTPSWVAQVLKDWGDQQCSATACRARPKMHATPSAGPTTTSGAKLKCPTMPDPVTQPKKLVRTYVIRIKESPSLWLEFLSLYLESASEVPMAFIQKMAKRQATFSGCPQPKPKLGWGSGDHHVPSFMQGAVFWAWGYGWDMGDSNRAQRSMSATATLPGFRLAPPGPLSPLPKDDKILNGVPDPEGKAQPP